jgi:pyruvate-ferredoxin/flavodoxin oxidoreductase
MRDLALKEARYAMLARSEPQRSAELLDLAQAAIDQRWHYYEQLVGIERSVPHVPEPDPDAIDDLLAQIPEGDDQ